MEYTLLAGRAWCVEAWRSQAFCSACAKMLVRFLRSSESPHVSVFYQSAASLVVSLAATLIPKALGYEKALRMPHGWVEWSFMAGVGQYIPFRPSCSRVPWRLG